MSVRSKALAGLISAALIAAVVMGFFFLRSAWQRPLGPSIDLGKSTAGTSLETSAGQVAASAPHPSLTPGQAGSVTASPQAPSLQPSLTPPPSSEPPLTIVAVGADNTSGYVRGLADVIRVVRVDFATPKITMLAFPRDMWVHIPGIESHYGLNAGKINQAYFYGDLYSVPGGAGPGLLARTLDDNFGLRVDHYVAVNMSTFVKIVDAVGGIDIYLPRDVDGTTSPTPLPYFHAGPNHFNGEQALAYSRIRYVDKTELARIDRQTEVLCALRKKVLSPEILPKVPGILQSFLGNVVTDLTPEEISRLVAIAPSIRAEDIHSATIPSELLKIGVEYELPLANPPVTTSVWHWDQAGVRDLVSAFMQGTYPGGPGQSPCK